MLVHFELTHLPILKNWVVDEDLLFQFSAHGFTFPLTEKQFIDYQKEHPERQFYLAYLESNLPYAFGEIIPQDEHSVRIARLLVGGKKNRGKGLGLQLVHELLTEIKQQNKANHVDLYVLEKNNVAIRCYEKAGFTFTKDKPFMLSHKNQDYPVLKMTKFLMK